MTRRSSRGYEIDGKRRESIFIEACFTTREDEWGLASPGVPRRPSRTAAWAPWLLMLALFLAAVVRW